MELTELLQQGINLVQRLLDLLTKRPPLQVILLQEGDGDMKEFRAIVPLPAVLPADHVTVREMTFIVDGVAQQATNLPPETMQFEQWCREGTTVKFSLRDADDATPANWSTPTTSADIPVTDTIPPRQPGGGDTLSVQFVEEREAPTT